MNKSKARLAFEMLENEMEALSQEKQRNLKGGDIGAVTSGTGTSNGPFIITIPICYGNH